MIKNYLKIAWRNLVKNKASSFINIGGLAVGMAVAMLIGLWIWDELTVGKNHQNYSSGAIVMQNQTYNGETNTNKSIPVPLGAELQKNYSGDFKHIIMASQNYPHIMRVGNKNL